LKILDFGRAKVNASEVVTKFRVKSTAFMAGPWQIFGTLAYT